MKTLVLDIETAPNVSHTWGLWQQNVGLPQLLASGYVLCWAAKWVGEPKMHWGRTPKPIYNLVDKADVVVGFNHIRFDMKHLNGWWLREGLTPPSPYHNIDLCNVSKQRFNMPSNKLAYLAQELLEGQKASTGGHQTWIGCMANKPDAWAKMRAYNEHDVHLTEALYERLKPWIKLPSPYLYGDVADPQSCPGCGSTAIRSRGKAYTQLTAYQRLYCPDCGRWARGKNLTRQQVVR